ncbi:MAG: DUF4911 domain-containing protein [Deltaproteobacteria bacterium]|nr:DUF4911 domain-containing protein [Deltaproteobacteria bacterium]
MDSLQADALDECCLALYLEVPGSKVVLLQGLFELYEDLAVVRTLSVKRSLVCLITTKHMLRECMAALESIREMVPWRPAARPSDEERELYLGYFRKAKQI